MANEELILERLIRLTKSGKILWWRTGKGYKTNIEGVWITIRVESGMFRYYCDSLEVHAPCRDGSYLGYYDLEDFSEKLIEAIENQISGESMDILEGILREMEEC